MSRFVLFFCFLFIIIQIDCRQTEETPHIAVVCRQDDPHVAAYFRNAASRTADSLSLRITIIEDGGSFSNEHYDSLLTGVAAIAVPATIKNENLAKIVTQKKRTPVVALDMHSHTSNNYYSAGRAAGRHVAAEFGESGRFGILTSSLDNNNSNESIRGFREELMSAQNKWRQVNIITFGANTERALSQFRALNRFGARTIWLITDGAQDFLSSLSALKKNNYFIAVDLNANKSYIKLLQENTIDAVSTQDVRASGTRCVLGAAAALEASEITFDANFRASILVNTDNGPTFE